MIAEQVAHIIADVMAYVELGDEDDINPDFAMDIIDSIGNQLNAMEPSFLRELVDAFAVIAPQFNREAEQVVRDIPYGFFLEERLAADDPVRLAELEARREEREASDQGTGKRRSGPVGRTSCWWRPMLLSLA